SRAKVTSAPPSSRSARFTPEGPSPAPKVAFSDHSFLNIPSCASCYVKQGAETAPPPCRRKRDAPLPPTCPPSLAAARSIYSVTAFAPCYLTKRRRQPHVTDRIKQGVLPPSPEPPLFLGCRGRICRGGDGMKFHRLAACGYGAGWRLVRILAGRVRSRTLPGHVMEAICGERTD